jgi:hypothetical protein
MHVGNLDMLNLSLASKWIANRDKVMEYFEHLSIIFESILSEKRLQQLGLKT